MPFGLFGRPQIKVGGPHVARGPHFGLA